LNVFIDSKVRRSSKQQTRLRGSGSRSVDSVSDDRYLVFETERHGDDIGSFLGGSVVDSLEMISYSGILFGERRSHWQFFVPDHCSDIDLLCHLALEIPGLQRSCN
jgi:hypothetical protein